MSSGNAFADSKGSIDTQLSSLGNVEEKKWGAVSQDKFREMVAKVADGKDDERRQGAREAAKSQVYNDAAVSDTLYACEQANPMYFPAAVDGVIQYFIYQGTALKDRKGVSKINRLKSAPKFRLFLRLLRIDENGRGAGEDAITISRIAQVFYQREIELRRQSKKLSADVSIKINGIEVRNTTFCSNSFPFILEKVDLSDKPTSDPKVATVRWWFSRWVDWNKAHNDEINKRNPKTQNIQPIMKRWMGTQVPEDWRVREWNSFLTDMLASKIVSP